jgi:hypothetical protein
MTSTADKLRAYADSEIGWQNIDDLCRQAADELDAAYARTKEYERALTFILENPKRPNLWYAGVASTVLYKKETACPTQTNS